MAASLSLIFIYTCIRLIHRRMFYCNISKLRIIIVVLAK